MCVAVVSAADVERGLGAMRRATTPPGKLLSEADMSRLTVAFCVALRSLCSTATRTQPSAASVVHTLTKGLLLLVSVLTMRDESAVAEAKNSSAYLGAAETDRQHVEVSGKAQRLCGIPRQRCSSECDGPLGLYERHVGVVVQPDQRRVV